MSSARKNLLGVAQIAPLLVVVLFIAGILAFSTKSGIPGKENFVLSENEGSSGSSGSGSSGSSSNDDDDDDDDSSSDDSSSVPSGSGGSSSGGTGDEIRSETRYTSGVRVRTRQKDDRTRIDIYEGGRKLRIETRDGQTVVKVENEEEEEIESLEFEEEEELEVEASGGARIQVRTRGNRILLRQGVITAQTNFPVTVDQETGELTITTPAGTRVVSILPEQAVENMLAANVIDRILANLPVTTAPTASPGAEIATSQAIELDEEDGEIVYVLEGAIEERFLGLIRVLVPKTVVVSAQDGGLITVRQPLISRILDLLSF